MYNPEKIKDVPILLKDYRGQEELMLAKISEKYGVDLRQPLQPQPEAEVRSACQAPKSSPTPPIPTNPTSALLALLCYFDTSSSRHRLNTGRGNQIDAVEPGDGG